MKCYYTWAGKTWIAPRYPTWVLRWGLDSQFVTNLRGVYSWRDVPKQQILRHPHLQRRKNPASTCSIPILEYLLRHSIQDDQQCSNTRRSCCLDESPTLAGRPQIKEKKRLSVQDGDDEDSPSPPRSDISNCEIKDQALKGFLDTRNIISAVKGQYSLNLAVVHFSFFRLWYPSRMKIKKHLRKALTWFLKTWNCHVLFNVDRTLPNQLLKLPLLLLKSKATPPEERTQIMSVSWKTPHRNKRMK